MQLATVILFRRQGLQTNKLLTIGLELPSLAYIYIDVTPRELQYLSLLFDSKALLQMQTKLTIT